MTDPWRSLQSDEDIPEAGFVIIPLQRWLDERSDLIERTVPLGLLIAAGDDVETVSSDLSRFAVIAVDFPAFTDGRSYSSARIIRERHGYSGELRATGDVLLDQMALMRRVGIDAFDVSHVPTIDALQAGNSADVALHLQPAYEHGEIQSGNRSWARRDII